MRLLLASTAAASLVASSAALQPCQPLREVIGLFEDDLEEFDEHDPLVKLIKSEEPVPATQRITFFSPTKDDAKNAKRSYRNLKRGDYGPVGEEYTQEHLMAVLRNHVVPVDMHTIPHGVAATLTNKDKVDIAVTPSGTTIKSYKTDATSQVLSVQGIDTCAGTVYEVDDLLIPQGVGCAPLYGKCGGDHSDDPPCCANTADLHVECVEDHKWFHQCLSTGPLQPEDVIPQLKSALQLNVEDELAALSEEELSVLDHPLKEENEEWPSVGTKLVLTTEESTLFQAFYGKDYLPTVTTSINGLDALPDKLVSVEDIPDGFGDVADEIACMELCEATPGCNGASFYVDATAYGDNNCWLKKFFSSCDLPTDALENSNAVLLLLDEEECPELIVTASAGAEAESGAAAEVEVETAAELEAEAVAASDKSITTSDPVTQTTDNAATTSRATGLKLFDALIALAVSATALF